MKQKQKMLKSYAREEITQIMRKTMVEFLSAESSICHCFPFLYPPLAMSDGVLV